MQRHLRCRGILDPMHEMCDSFGFQVAWPGVQVITGVPHYSIDDSDSRP